MDKNKQQTKKKVIHTILKKLKHRSRVFKSMH